jgi:hypothetical protein
MTGLERLQAWYADHCNGLWEHSYGIKIDTLDNPGWTVEVDLNETDLEGHQFEKSFTERSEDDWFFAEREEMKFKVACGPRNLDEALAIFCDWAERSREGD